uniref:Ubiquitin-like domain-containing protein n=1 Tax=Timspurckia oligopyrenoides TaxID=708627 RepID=A0A7S1ERR4_9RHOD|mmetsp:Transcript_2324/g.4071  ORF Transcript_2324/g.4071 Transcript_2324/m.4071 type:complete len:275 (+) Transcript_2324:131-955(+)|eukprot:CAMPEP_0182447700 /NCGR_PEP_ID=MMETSP1172-20130603/18941_1 /TAXON_ID=708627 /ORGANISM="Timspurckia oligopyrenoides, Strain CCMP3278" /LENGTH=274 /DNA_ID=CAMNT_0024644233 /DNA_START=113 /DNA_END=937 /DNA_ORIENTATION=+
MTQESHQVYSKESNSETKDGFQIYVLMVGSDERNLITILHDSVSPTVQDLRQSIFLNSKLNLDPMKHRLRIIYQGKLLSDATQLLSSAKISPFSTVHCSVTDTTPSTDENGGNESEEQRVIQHRIVYNPNNETRILMLDENEISMRELRQLILEQATNYRIARRMSQQNGEGEEEDADLEELEERVRQFELENVIFDEDEDDEIFLMTERDGEWSDFVWGFLLGFFLGVIMLIISLDRTINLSRKWRSGILCGVILNMTFSITMLMADKHRHRI